MALTPEQDRRSERLLDAVMLFLAFVVVGAVITIFVIDLWGTPPPTRYRN